MTYHNAIKFIKNAPDSIPEAALGADRINKLFDALGNPQKKIKYIRLAGNNGKTVCARMLISILNSADIKNGCLSMPIYTELRDNIRINGEPITMDETVSYVEQICTAISAINSSAQSEEGTFSPTTNEIMLCMALLAFVEHKCSVCMLESDHNGEDPSRFMPHPLGAVICGKIPSGDKSEISKIRSYICRGIAEIVSVPQDQEAYAVISETCFSANCRLTLPAKNKFSIKSLTLGGTDFIYKDLEYSINLCGKFEIANAVVSIEAAEMLIRHGYKIENDHVRQGLAKVTAPCKFEVLSLSPTIIADSTHSEVAIGTVCDALADFKEMIGTRVRLCLPEGELVSHFVNALSERGYSIEKISALKSEDELEEIQYPLPVSLQKDHKATAKDALKELDKDTILLISGPSNFTRKLRYELLAILGF